MQLGNQLVKIKNLIAKELYGRHWGDEDLIFYPVFRWEEDGAYTIHIILNCLKMPRIGAEVLQMVVRTLAQKFSLVAGACLTGNIEREVLNEFGEYLVDYYACDQCLSNGMAA